MKPTSTALTIFFVSSCAADNAATNAFKKNRKGTDKMLKTRRLNSEDANMSMDTTGSIFPGFGWGDNHDHDCGVPSATKCAGRPFFKILLADQLGIDGLSNTGTVPWSTFFDATPENCVLAPIHTPSEWDELLIEATALLSGSEAEADNLWIGIIKSAAAVGTGGGSTAGWFNLDGTAVPDMSGFWGGSEPNNSPAYQTRVHMWFEGSGNPGGLLRDLNNGGNTGPGVHGAIYKCCDDNVVTFPSCNY